jgi:hypothetical protein
MQSLFTRKDDFPEDLQILDLQDPVNDIFPSEPRHKILVRRDYVKLHEEIQLLANNRTRSASASGVVVTGQPGIGMDYLFC